MKLNLILPMATALALVSIQPATAQNAPGSPNGILSQEFQLQKHPQLEFPASAPDPKYQHGVSAMRKRGDLGDPDNSCNLQCPDSN
jgi:hypothetical protein